MNPYFVDFYGDLKLESPWYFSVLEDTEPKSPFDHSVQPAFPPTFVDVSQSYGPGWGTQQTHNGTYNVDTTQQHYPPNGMAQQAQNGTYNSNTHFVVNPPSMVAQQADNGPYDPYAPHPY